MDNIQLTAKQREFYEALRTHIEGHGMAPTIAELMDTMNLSSPRSVSQYLESLERKGLIIREHYGQRSIRLVDPNEKTETVTIPVISSAGCDNVNVFADDSFTGFVCVQRELLAGRPREKMISVKAVGESMVDAGVNDGDYVLVEVTEAVSENDLVVAVIDGFAVIKKLQLANNAVILQPVSPDPQYKPIILRKDFKIFGKVIDIIRMPQTGELDIVPIYH
ncbi:MAG: transcriptional repressor LexA [Patescibacteria group bacterium]